MVMHKHTGTCSTLFLGSRTRDPHGGEARGSGDLSHPSRRSRGPRSANRSEIGLYGAPHFPTFEMDLTGIPQLQQALPPSPSRSDSHALPYCSGGQSGAGRQPWDVRRFLGTVSFFNRPPSFQQLLQGLLVDTPTRIIRKLAGLEVWGAGRRR